MSDPVSDARLNPPIQDGAEDPVFRAMGWTREQERSYLAYQEEIDAIHECEQINGVSGPCQECGEYSLRESTVTTLGYRGHPGEERSALYTCINPECGHTDLAG